MKLNAGCGKNYIENWINIDINPLLKCDFVMSAHNLEFENETFEKVMALHVIEHLGFFKTKYFLSESYRVLKDGGGILIETPHIEKTFENFLKAKTSLEREIILGWIYGSESLYQNHLYCFPLELLEKLVSQAGFDKIRIEFYDYQPLRPAVRIEAVKKKDACFDRLCELRKKILKEGKPDFSDELSMAETEKEFL